MPAVRYFNSTPHFVRFGSHDDDESWMLFWRNGVKFEITVNRSDVRDTRFEKKWVELNDAQDLPSSGPDDNRWELLCDCVIFQCLDLLEQVAPDGKEYWRTFKDYIHTPGYKIKVVANKETGDAEGQLEDGCMISGAYEVSPLPVEEVGIMTDQFRGYRSEDLQVQDRETNWSCSRRVQAPDGTLFRLKQIEDYLRWVDTGEIVNHSLDDIAVHLKIHNHCLQHPLGYPDRIPQVLGYVTDDIDASENRKEDLNRLETGRGELFTGTKSQTLIAGILLTDLPSCRTLWDLIRDSKDDYDLLEVIKTNQAIWKSQTLAAVKDVHTRGMACTEPNSSGTSFADQCHISVDNNQEVFLDECIKFFKTEGTAANFEQVKAKDLNSVHRTFDEWLPKEIDEVERQHIKRKFNI